jgi:type IV pilus assembly protein PilO
MAAKSQFDFKDPLNVFMLVIILLVTTGVSTFWVYYYDELQKQIDKVTKQITEKERTFNKVMAQVAQKEDFLQKKAQAQIKLRKLKAMFPDEEKIPFRLNDLYKAIKKTGVGITKFEPLAAVKKKTPKKKQGKRKQKKSKKDGDVTSYFQENHYKIVLNGGFHMFGNMFAEVANFDYPTQISSLKIKPYAGLKSEIEKSKQHGTPPRTMNVEIKLTTYSSRK